MTTGVSKEERRKISRELKDLADSPEKQAEYAVRLLQPKYGLELIRAAVGVLAKTPVPRARNELRTLYWRFAENNGTRDPAAYTRSAILKALREVMGMDDVELVVDAVTTYEFLPPSFTEEAGLLRSTAIVLLAELDDTLARFFATRLLADGYTESMSGQPALTAVRVLASLGEFMPLYYYATQQSGSNPEVTAECLRNLGDSPPVVVAELVKQYSKADAPAALAGLFELLLSGPAAPLHSDFLADFLKSSQELDLYRYLVTLMATSTNPAVRQLLADATVNEQKKEKVEILSDALQYAPMTPELDAIRKQFG